MIEEYKKHYIEIPSIYRVLSADGVYHGLIMVDSKDDYQKMVNDWKDKKTYKLEDWTQVTASELFSMLVLLNKNDLFNKYHIDLLNLINLKIKNKQFAENSIEFDEMSQQNFDALKKVMQTHGYNVTKRPTKKGG